ncbi:MAG TPA: glycine oxidase ThiO [Longimicrobiales bacterium]
MNGKRVIVAGGGLIGCAVAWRLAQRGAKVRVIESARPGAGASSAAAGMLAPLIEAHHDALRVLSARSIARFPGFVEELREASSIDAELQLSGKVDVAFDDQQFDVLRARYGDQLPEGVRELTGDEARGVEPHVAEQATRAVFSAADGSVDNRKLMRASWLAASHAGAEFRTGSSVREVVCGRSGFEAVHLSTGERIEGDAVVVCAGAWSSSIRGLPLPLPVFPVRGQMVALELVPRVLQHIVMTMRCYIVPRTDGRVLVGSTVERAGFDPRTTASGIAHLLNAALEAVPALADANLVDSWAGLRPGTSDELPILGADPRAPGVFYATGHYRNGILLAPITADAVAAAVMEDGDGVDLSAFSAARFHER